MNRRTFLKTSGTSALGVAALSAGLPRSVFSQTTPIWLNTLFHGGDARAMEIIVEKLNKEQKAFRVDLTQGGWTEYYAQLHNAVVAGVGPNIGICHNFQFLKSHPVFYPLNDTPIGDVLKLKSWSKADFIPAAWDAAQVGGVQYGIPLDQNMAGLYYNKTIFKQAGLDPNKPPKNRQEFEAACEAIKKTGKLAFHPAFNSPPRWIRRSFYILHWSAGGRLIDETGKKAAFNNKTGLETLTYLVDMVGKRGWNKPGTDANKQFLAGELGMCYNGTWFYLTLDSAPTIDYGCAPVPNWFGTQVTWGTTHNLVLPKQPKGKAHEERLRVTVDALAALVSNTHLWGEFGGHVPMYKKALEDPRLRGSKTWQKTLGVFYEMAFGGVWRTYDAHPKIVEFNAAVEPHIQEAYNGTISPQEALTRAERDGNAALAA